MFRCSTHCYYNTNFYIDYQSCLYGCDVFDEANNCYNDTHYNHDYLDRQNTEEGCYYNLNKYLLPEYTVLESSIGMNENVIGTYYNCFDNCVDFLRDICNNNFLCVGCHYYSTAHAMAGAGCGSHGPNASPFFGNN